MAGKNKETKNDDTAVEGEYNGHPTITLKRDAKDTRGFTFGLAKARLVLAHTKEIESFVEKHEDDGKGE